MYQFKNQWWSIYPHHFSAESALEPALPLCSGCKFIKRGPCFLECPRVLKVRISDSVNVQLVKSTPLVFTVSSFSAGMFCPVKFVCGVSSLCHHSVVTRILPWLIWMTDKSISSEGKNYMCFPHGCPCLASNLGFSRQTGKQMRVVPRYANSKVAVICLCAFQVAE